MALAPRTLPRTTRPHGLPVALPAPSLKPSVRRHGTFADVVWLLLLLLALIPTASPLAAPSPPVPTPSTEQPPCAKQLQGASLVAAHLLSEASYSDDSLASTLDRARASIPDLESVLHGLREWPCTEHAAAPWYPYRMQSALLLYALAPTSDAAVQSLFNAVTKPSPYGSADRVWLNEDGPFVLAKAYQFTPQVRVLQRLLQLGSGDAALGEAVESVYDDLIESHPLQFLEAVRALPLEVQVQTLAEAVLYDGLSKGRKFNECLKAALAEPARSLTNPLHLQAELVLLLIEQGERASNDALRPKGGA